MNGTLLAAEGKKKDEQDGAVNDVVLLFRCVWNKEWLVWNAPCLDTIVLGTQGIEAISNSPSLPFNI